MVGTSQHDPRAMVTNRSAMKGFVMNPRPHVSFGPWLSLCIAVSSLASVCSCSPTDRLSSIDLVRAETSPDVPRRRGRAKQAHTPISSFAFHSRQKLLGTGVNDGDYFGDSAAISGDFAFIGADGDDANGVYSGAVYVFKQVASEWLVGNAKIPRWRRGCAG